MTSIICGHRGGGGDPESVTALTAHADWSHQKRAPDHYDYRTIWENRLQTFTYMLEKGITCFELDLLPSQEGEAMLIHDSVIDKRHVSTWSTTELKQKGFATLDELLTVLEKTEKKITLLLELKGSASSETVTDSGELGISKQSKTLIDKMLSILHERVEKTHVWSYEQLPLIGFNHAMLIQAKKANPNIHIGFSYGKEELEHSASRMIKEAKKAGAYAINPDDRLLTKELVDATHKAGLKVQSWTAYEIEERPEEMIEMGVDTLITDFPLASQKLL